MNRLVLAAVAVVCLGGALWGTEPVRAAYRRVDKGAGAYYLPPARWLRPLVLGYNEAAADIIWVQTVVYFAKAPQAQVRPGEVLTPQTAARIAARAPRNFTTNYVLTASKLDPYFKEPYLKGAPLTLYHKGVITRDTVRMAIDILETGVRYFPEDGQMHFNLGFLYYYEAKPFITDEAERARYRRKAIEHFQAAGRTRNAPPYAAQLAMSLMEKHDMSDYVVDYLKQRLAHETDPRIRATLRRQLADALQQQHAADVARIDALWRRWERSGKFIDFDAYAFWKGGTWQVPPEETDDHL